ncbi:hypothetical protein AVEN_163693-1 [Araneus ventricosus]|uniref:Uncharacterized protein n=1 Tax=Araneus ventricosus TaxID=182803 RepID=A0A4Y2WXG4_ARAVE|nr:hypothetical protein AVEN_163693-1 [Araneus ventricosus]
MADCPSILVGSSAILAPEQLAAQETLWDALEGISQVLQLTLAIRSCHTYPLRRVLGSWLNRCSSTTTIYNTLYFGSI